MHSQMLRALLVISAIIAAAMAQDEASAPVAIEQPAQDEAAADSDSEVERWGMGGWQGGGGGWQGGGGYNGGNNCNNCDACCNGRPGSITFRYTADSSSSNNQVRPQGTRGLTAKLYNTAARLSSRKRTHASSSVTGPGVAGHQSAPIVLRLFLSQNKSCQACLRSCHSLHSPLSALFRAPGPT